MSSEYMDYYVEWDCPSCEETNYAGVRRTYLRHRGKAVIPFDDGACENYTCSECGASSYSGDLDLFSDG